MITKIENYTCDKCGNSFQVTDKDRMATFTLHTPHNWPCPECGTMCFSLKTEEVENDGPLCS